MCIHISEINSTGDAIDYLSAHGWKPSEAVEFVGLLCKIAKKPRAVSALRPATELRQVKRSFPPDFVLTPELVKVATDRGFNLADVHEMWGHFRDHYLGNGKSFSDWAATWRNWVRKAVEFKNRDQRNATPAMDWRA
ncbi:hypothetical protein [Bradyrhizobium sp. Tv2a-2]|uniref:hypothetical protein n=1 Tax=Bradyrhizobium sp. Tv2a-2 TaxID=113395 RepID=UPI000401E6C3|nr:hypothetical protein [Bradyrhizobium sp. Tv2a-2]